MLVRHHETLWTWAVPHRFHGLRIGTRMTIVRLGGGGLWLHSPIGPAPEVVAAIGSLGEVGHIVCPNLFHHVYAGEMQRAFPRAILHAPTALARKRPDVRIDAELSPVAHPDWAAELVPVPIRGTLLHETVFLHGASRTLVSSDLVENFPHGSEHALTDLWLRLGGVRGRVGWHRLFRVAYRDLAAARHSLDRLLALDFDRVVLAHGEVIERGGREAIRDAFTWLRA